MKILVCLLLLLGTLNRSVAQTNATIPLQQQLDLVTSLPGQPNVSFAQYAGYVNVNETAGRSLFYYFVEATSSPETKPLVLWLQGGPGCTSLGNGAWTELGPFFVKKDGYTLYENKHSWNRVANLLFLDSPAGVGFSYSNDTQDYVTADDAKTSYDSLVFLTRWFERFPQYNSRDFYIAGESYGGHYVPQLAKRVYDFNKGQQAAAPFMNLKGYLVGNGLIDNYQDLRGQFDFWWTRALISDETYAGLQQCLATFPESIASPGCVNMSQLALSERGNIDKYDIYAPVCVEDNPFTNGSSRGESKAVVGGYESYDPCVNFSVTAYFQRPDVQEALHANATRLSYPWALCSDIVATTYNPIDIYVASVIPIYEELVQTGLKIWVLSGDVDARVPVLSTRYSLQLLKLNTTVPWHAWYLDQQVGGYTQEYDGLTFVTVRDAGHQIPRFQPARALAVLESYISGQRLPVS